MHLLISLREFGMPHDSIQFFDETSTLLAEGCNVSCNIIMMAFIRLEFVLISKATKLSIFLKYETSNYSFLICVQHAP